MCVCVSERESEKERERKRKRDEGCSRGRVRNQSVDPDNDEKLGSAVEPEVCSLISVVVVVVSDSDGHESFVLKSR